MSDGPGDRDNGPAGYARPPKKNQFQKGVSGNPRGRPRKLSTTQPQPRAGSVHDVILADAARLVTVTEGGQTVQMPFYQALFRSIAATGFKGNVRAQAKAMDLIIAAEKVTAAERREAIVEAIDFKNRWRDLKADCDRTGAAYPEFPGLHPDDIAFDAVTGELLINGPRDEREKCEWDEILALRQNVLEQLEEYNEIAARKGTLGPDDQTRASDLKAILAKIDLRVVDVETRRAPGFKIHTWMEMVSERQRREKSRRRKEGKSD